MTLNELETVAQKSTAQDRLSEYRRILSTLPKQKEQQNEIAFEKIFMDLNLSPEEGKRTAESADGLAVLKLATDFILASKWTKMARKSAQIMLNWLDNELQPTLINLLWKQLGRYFVLFQGELLQGLDMKSAQELADMKQSDLSLDMKSQSLGIDLIRVIQILKAGVFKQRLAFESSSGSSKTGLAFLKFYISHWMTVCRVYAGQIVSDASKSAMHVQSVFDCKAMLKEIQSTLDQQMVPELRVLTGQLDSLITVLYKQPSASIKDRINLMRVLMRGDGLVALEFVLLAFQACADLEQEMKLALMNEGIVDDFLRCFLGGLPTSVWVTPMSLGAKHTADDNNEWTVFDQVVYTVTLLTVYMPTELFESYQKTLFETMLNSRGGAGDHPIASPGLRLALMDAWIEYVLFQWSAKKDIQWVQCHVDWLVRLLSQLNKHPDQAVTVAWLIRRITDFIPDVKIQTSDGTPVSGQVTIAEDTAAILKYLPDQMKNLDELVSLTAELLRSKQWEACIFPMKCLSECESTWSQRHPGIVSLLVDAISTPGIDKRFVQIAIALVSSHLQTLKSKQIFSVLDYCVTNLSSTIIATAIKLLLAVAVVPYKSIQPAESQQTLIQITKTLFEKLFQQTERDSELWLENHLLSYVAFVFSALTDWPVYRIFDEQLSAKWVRYLERTPISVDNTKGIEKAFDFSPASARRQLIAKSIDGTKHETTINNMDSHHNSNDQDKQRILEILNNIESIVSNPRLLAQIKNDTDLSRRMDFISSLWMKR